jgi:hypothetical protein
MTTTRSPQRTPDDQDVRDALSPLRDAAPEAVDLAALRRRLASTAPAPRRTRRTVGAIATATAVVGIGIALLPGSDDPGSRSSSALGALVTPSALASDVPPVADGPYRYVRVRDTYTYVTTRGDRSATLRSEQTGESWVSAGWKGRQLTEYGASRTTGDPALAGPIGRSAPQQGTSSDGPFLYGDGPLATLDPAELPTEQDAIARTIREGIRSNRWGANGKVGPRRSGGPSDDAYFAYSIVGLLVNARLTTDQRAAFLDILRTAPGARDGGVGADAIGRRGQVVDLSYGRDQTLLGVRGLRVVFDPGSDEILEWSLIPEPPTDDQPNMARTETVLRSAYVDSTRDRP